MFVAEIIFGPCRRMIYDWVTLVFQHWLRDHKLVGFPLKLETDYNRAPKNGDVLIWRLISVRAWSGSSVFTRSKRANILDSVINPFLIQLSSALKPSTLNKICYEKDEYILHSRKTLTALCLLYDEIVRILSRRRRKLSWFANWLTTVSTSSKLWNRFPWTRHWITDILIWSSN